MAEKGRHEKVVIGRRLDRADPDFDRSQPHDLVDGRILRH
jgi:hypothetical protein